MLQNKITNWLQYCKNSNFAEHSFAAHLNDNEADVLQIQDLLGHATPRTTSDYYIHPSEKKVRQALEKLPGVIYMNQLVQSGLIKFHSRYNRRE